MASFLAKLSWHDDNKVQMYQAAEEVIKVLKRFLADAHPDAVVCPCVIVENLVRRELSFRVPIPQNANPAANERFEVVSPVHLEPAGKTNAVFYPSPAAP